MMPLNPKPLRKLFADMCFPDSNKVFEQLTLDSNISELEKLIPKLDW